MAFHNIKISLDTVNKPAKIYLIDTSPENFMNGKTILIYALFIINCFRP